MKKIVATLLLGASTLLLADFVEVKTGYGKTYYKQRQAPRLYVCYQKRIKYVSDDGRIYLRYDGCGRYRDSCRYNGLARFGRYPSENAARSALYRCQTATPRFVD